MAPSRGDLVRMPWLLVARVGNSAPPQRRFREPAELPPLPAGPLYQQVRPLPVKPLECVRSFLISARNLHLLDLAREKLR